MATLMTPAVTSNSAAMLGRDGRNMFMVMTLQDAIRMRVIRAVERTVAVTQWSRFVREGIRRKL